MNTTSNNSKKLFALNKPKGYVVTRSDERGRKTVYDLLPDWAFDEGLMPIGRLDLESKGLLLFTTDGKTGNALTKPGGVASRSMSHVTDAHIAEAMKGVQSKHGLLKALKIEKIGMGGAKTRLRVIIDEGKNRHIRRLFWSDERPKVCNTFKGLKPD